MAGGSFDRTRQLMGLSANKRLDDFIAVSPFDYKENCLLYIPMICQRRQMGSEKETKCLAEQICRLVEVTHGHTLVLITSYSLMGAVYNQVKEQLSFPLMVVWRHSQDVIHQFKQAQNAVLFAAGSCWEVWTSRRLWYRRSSLYDCLFLFLILSAKRNGSSIPPCRTISEKSIIPDMQVNSGKGSDGLSVLKRIPVMVSILDYRAAPGERYHRAVLETLHHFISPEKSKM